MNSLVQSTFIGKKITDELLSQIYQADGHVKVMSLDRCSIIATTHNMPAINALMTADKKESDEEPSQEDSPQPPPSGGEESSD